MHIQYRWLAASAIACCVLGQSAHADLLGLTLPDTPRISVENISITYFAGSDQLLITGGTLSLDTGGGAGVMDLAEFTIEATINEEAFAGSGSLGIGSPVQTGADDPMLTAELIDFGYLFYAVGSTNFNGLFEFVFMITGGELADMFGGVGATAGVMIDAGGGLAIDNFEVNFGNAPGAGTATAAPIPAPASITLLGIAAIGRRRRRRA